MAYSLALRVQGAGGVLASAAVQASEQIIESIRTEFPAFRIVEKQGDRLSHTLDWLLKILTLGGQRQYLTHYHTVLGFTLYVPSAWQAASDVERAIVLRHERVHLRQRRRYGMALFAFLYLVPLLPLGLAWGRARLEWEAYSETLRATAELCGLAAVGAPELRRKIVGRFTGGAYGWMWPFEAQVQRWYDRVLGEIEAGSAGLVGQSGRRPAAANETVGLSDRARCRKS